MIEKTRANEIRHWWRGGFEKLVWTSWLWISSRGGGGGGMKMSGSIYQLINSGNKTSWKVNIWMIHASQGIISGYKRWKYYLIVKNWSICYGHPTEPFFQFGPQNLFKLGKKKINNYDIGILINIKNKEQFPSFRFNVLVLVKAWDLPVIPPFTR